MARTFFRIEMLPAHFGDALWIEYGDESRTRRVVVDGGPIGAYEQFADRFTRLPDGDKRVELFVITHVDTDHIEGAIRLLAAPRNQWPFAPHDVWFNGYRHLRKTDLGGREGEFLSALIRARVPNEWNKAFKGEAVSIGDATGTLPKIPLAGGMTLTLLSPNPAKLEKLVADWEKHVHQWSIKPGDLEQAWAQLAGVKKFVGDTGLTLGDNDLDARLDAQLKKQDQATANGSSIAFLAEFGGKSCLLLADAHMDLILESLERLCRERGVSRLKVDALKLAHHGSKHNFKTKLLQLVDTRNFLVSTNGVRTGHPDAAAIDSVILHAARPIIWFNYRSATTTGWEKKSKERGATYETKYPASGDGITVEL
jgi:hypothetical protein